LTPMQLLEFWIFGIVYKLYLPGCAALPGLVLYP
jgi:hypothetical protein